ncbi:MAG: GH3 auxin-responsive promoter family protein [Bacteroidetes bacterium]|nr:GH3 auxin-responsive promoter family protein [Bacteroidota bacterium]
MKLKTLFAKPFANYIYSRLSKDMDHAVENQELIMKQLVKSARGTVFGKDHDFASIKSYDDFRLKVPVSDYEELKKYIELIKEGKQNILWKGKPIYFAKTSGTTSGVKYIPITKESIANHINTARDALLCYIAQTGNAGFTDGKMIFLSGSPTLERIGGIPTGRLSGIVNHHIPRYLRSNQLPTFETNCIEDWETKLDKIVEETLGQNMTLISGIPPWMQMYFDRLQEKTGKKIMDIFPNLSLIVQGGVNFDPYKKRLFESIGKKVDYIELYPASEGFIAFQDRPGEEGLLLNTNSGIFYEFIPVEEMIKGNPNRISLKDVEIGKNYVLIINSNAGLWGYNLGDTIKFVSKNPYRLLVTGRLRHFISAFGEHVIAEEVDEALLKTAEEKNVKIVEFTVAPKVQSNDGKSYHEWFIEFENMPDDLESFACSLDQNLRKKNVYYDDLITGNILESLHIRPIYKNGFIEYMRSIDKLGGQNKLPRLSNDRTLADALEPFILS